MKLTYKTKPWPHQARVLKERVRTRGGGLQVPMRWGKSWVGINWAAALFHLEGVRRVLVITVTSGLGVWENQVAQHCPLPWRVLDFHGELRAESEGFEPDKGLTFMLVNYPNLYTRGATGEGREWLPMPHPGLRKFGAQAAIADESHHIGNPTSVQFKHAWAIVRSIKFRLFMTGTMFHRKPFYVFGQVKWYNDGATFGGAFTHFKKRIAVFGGYGNYEVKEYKNLEWMIGELKPFTYMEEQVPHRPYVFNEITFDLEGKHLKAYMDMDTHKVLDLGKEKVVSELVITQHLRLLQIVGGFVKLPSGKYANVGNCKLTVCQNRLEEYLWQDIDKAVIGCRFLPELIAVAKVAKKLGYKPILFHGRVPPGDERTRRIADFQDTGKRALFISQIATGKESIDLSAASVMMMYSLSESYVEYDQFTSRIEKYNEKRALMYDILLGNGTRDVVAWEAMQLKMDVAELIVKQPQLVEQLYAARQSRR